MCVFVFFPDKKVTLLILQAVLVCPYLHFTSSIDLKSEIITVAYIFR